MVNPVLSCLLNFHRIETEINNEENGFLCSCKIAHNKLFIPTFKHKLFLITELQFHFQSYEEKAFEFKSPKPKNVCTLNHFTKTSIWTLLIYPRLTLSYIMFYFTFITI